LPALASVSDGRTVILDTDILYDPDDAVNLVIAARTIENLTVVTADEVHGWRARGALALLESLGRSDVPVIEGKTLDSERLAIDPDILETFALAPRIDMADHAGLPVVSAPCRTGCPGMGGVGGGQLRCLVHPPPARLVDARPARTLGRAR
jgi:hypothetical protein